MLQFSAMQKSDMIDEIVERLEKQAEAKSVMWIFPHFEHVKKNIEHDKNQKLEASKNKHIIAKNKKFSDSSQLRHDEEYLHENSFYKRSTNIFKTRSPS